MQTKSSHRAALFIWWLGMTIGSHWPLLDVTGGNNDALIFGVDKWLHVVAYGGLSFGVLFLFGRGAKRVLALLVGLVLWAALDEWTQRFVGREVALADFIASSIGVGVGACFWVAAKLLGGHDGSFIAHTRVVTALTLVSRFFGLARDWALAFVFGFGPVLDAFVIAFMIPNLFRRLFGEGALAAAFIPQYTRVREKDEATATRFARRVIAACMVAVSLLCGLGLVIAFALRRFGDWDARSDLILRLTTVMIGYAPLICAVAIMGGVLQVRGKFALPASSPIVLNILIVLGCLAAYKSNQGLELGAAIVAVSVLFAGFVQFVWHWLSVPRYSIKNKPAMDPALMADAKRKLLLQWGPTVFGLAVFQLNVFADSLIALLFSAEKGATFTLIGSVFEYPMEVGAPAVLGAAARLYEFPLGVFGIALATAIYPALSASAGKPDAFRGLLHQGLRMTVFIGLPASVGLFLLREPLSDAIYHSGGSLQSGDSARVAAVLAGFAPAIWAYSMNHVLTRAFYAMGDTRTPVRIGMAMVGVNIVLNLVLIWPLGVAGLAWATAICAMLQTVLMMRRIRRHCDAPVDGAVVRSWVKTAVLTGAMTVAVWYVVRGFDASVMRRADVIALLLGATGLGAAVVLVGAIALRMPEWRWVVRGR